MAGGICMMHSIGDSSKYILREIDQQEWHPPLCDDYCADCMWNYNVWSLFEIFVAALDTVCLLVWFPVISKWVMLFCLVSVYVSCIIGPVVGHQCFGPSNGWPGMQLKLTSFRLLMVRLLKEDCVCSYYNILVMVYVSNDFADARGFHANVLPHHPLHGSSYLIAYLPCLHILPNFFQTDHVLIFDYKTFTNKPKVK